MPIQAISKASPSQPAEARIVYTDWVRSAADGVPGSQATTNVRRYSNFKSEEEEI